MFKVLQSRDFQVSQSASLVTAPFTIFQAHPPQVPSQPLPRLFPQPGLPFSSISTKQPSSSEILHRCCFLCKAFLFWKPWAPIKGNPFFYACLQHVYPINHFTLTECVICEAWYQIQVSLSMYIYLYMYTHKYIYIYIYSNYFIFCIMFIDNVSTLHPINTVNCKILPNRTCSFPYLFPHHIVLNIAVT